MKVGDKIKGFRFNHSIVNWNPQMEKLIDKTGIIINIRDDCFSVNFGYNETLRDIWVYPIKEYLNIHKQKLREEKLTQLLTSERN